ncbi:Gfo/Idh/MocA family oxidoreductase [Nonomuraea deserti]|uniref:Gfo/Idh/MocA family oxidoreductase n=1 Tax=Nonomuraea deserti TaxID=1848322 RepID=A0A4R4W5R1_9ACTN|nr:Gfo/Idh/MocA family oxidoreductase [Nonomuraea deserti]TDD12267.1 Gfo/Idh/MocA family oxidoreductase [Nonomuraea deserti]
MSEPTRVAVVGAGQWGEQHARAFSSRDDSRLVGVFSRDLARARRRAARWSTRAYDDLARMIDETGPDLISVCLPNTEHYAPTLELIGHGIPLLVEKPLVFHLDEADRLLDAARERDLFFAINLNHRYAEPVVRARRDLDDGRLGDLSFATWRFGGEGGPADSRGRHPHAGLIETQCHGIDLLEHLLGPIEAVSAEMARGGSTLVVAARFACGAVGSLVGSYDSSYAYPRAHHVEVNGDAGRLLIDDTTRRYEFSPAGSETRTVWEAGYFNDRGRSFHETFDAHLDALMPALRAGAAPPVPAEAGRRALRVAYRIIEAFETGRRVAVAPY